MDSTTVYAATALTVSGGPIRSITVSVNPSLTDEITVGMRADDGTETEAVSVRRKMGRLVVNVPSRSNGRRSGRSFLDRILGRGKVVHGDLVGGRGDNEPDYPPTLDLTVLVPLDCPARLTLSGETRAIVEDGIGTLRMDLSGGVSATVGAVLATRLEAAGNAWVTIASTHGDLTLDLTGSVKVEVARIISGDLSLRSAGCCVLEIEEGDIGGANVEMSGSSDARVQAQIAGDLTFNGSGSFAANFDRVLGQVESSHVGSGSIHVAGRRQSCG